MNCEPGPLGLVPSFLRAADRQFVVTVAETAVEFTVRCDVPADSTCAGVLATARDRFLRIYAGTHGNSQCPHIHIAAPGTADGLGLDALALSSTSQKREHYLGDVWNPRLSVGHGIHASGHLCVGLSQVDVVVCFGAVRDCADLQAKNPGTLFGSGSAGPSAETARISKPLGLSH